MTYLLDTNVVSETRRRRRSPAVVAWLESVRRADVFISVLVFGEVRHGIERLRARDPAQAAGLETWLATLEERYGKRAIPVDRDVAEAWGSMDPARRPPIIDGLMAATAQVHGLVLVTRNVTDVARTGVPFLNPWEHADT